LLGKVDHLLIGGGMANTFVKAEGYSVGRSLLEEDKVELARALMEKAKASQVQFLIPEDCVVADRFAQDAQTKVVPIDQIPDDWQVLDIGPKTVDKYRQIILQSKLVIWNGPMGVFELDPFAWGTKSIATALAECPGTTIVGGGDSAAALEKSGLSDEIGHISTGGGASLELMEGKVLPGVAVLEDR
jgi:phosphoglycerate kinase